VASRPEIGSRRRGGVPDRGRIAGSVVHAGMVVLTATVPLAELSGYATRLRSRTQGLGSFTTRPTGYAPVPGAVTEGAPAR
jgi:elongation factor G